jgi:hypothetical protein
MRNTTMSKTVTITLDETDVKVQSTDVTAHDLIQAAVATWLTAISTAVKSGGDIDSTTTKAMKYFMSMAVNGVEHMADNGDTLQ